MMLFGVRTYLKVAAGLGFEPRLMDSESTGLPLADPAMYDYAFKSLSQCNKKPPFWQ